MNPPKKPIPLNPGWNERRWKQLFDLEKPLNEIASINRGSDAIGRITRCMEIAESLGSNLDDEGLILSLPSFLKEMALKKPAP